MKRIILLTMVFVMMLVSLAGCYWGYEGHERGRREGRGGDYDRGGERGGDYHRGGERGGDYHERRY